MPGSDYAAFVRQRKDDIARVIREQRERSLHIADGITDARVRRAFLQAEAQHERDIADFWRRFFRRARKQVERPNQHDGGAGMDRPRRPSPRPPVSRGPSARPSGAIQLAGYSGPVLDAKGRRGVYLSASYLGAKTAEYGCARRLVRYVTDLGHVEWLDGVALAGSNIGENRAEMSAAFGLVEDLNRAARANAKVVFHLIVQLPHDVSPADRAEIMARWCEDQFGLRNLPYVWAVHTPDEDGDQRNYHGHVAVSFRPLIRVEPYAWDAARELKSELDSPEQFRVMREQFARVMTEVAQEAGLRREYTALSHAARGLKIKPTEHLGAHKTREVREGGYVAADARNRARIRRNEAMLKIDRLKRRQAAMERRLARVRRIEARAFDVVSASARPERRAPFQTRHASAAVRPRRVTDALGTKVVIAIRDAALPARGIAASSSTRPAARSTEASPIAARSTRAQRPAVVATGAIAPVTLCTAVDLCTSLPVSRPAMIDRTPLPAHIPIIPGSPAKLPTSNEAGIGGSDAANRPASPPSVIGYRPSVRRSLDEARSAAINVIAVIRDDARPATLAAAASAVRPELRTATLASVSSIAMTPAADRSDRPTIALSASTDRLPSPTARIDEALLLAAFGEPARRRRGRAKAGAPDAVLAASDQISWTAATIEGDVPLDKVGSFDRIDILTPAPMTALTDRVRAVDFYVHDDGTGRLELDPRAEQMLGVSQAELDQQAEQAALADLRREQQGVVADLVAEVERRPLAFSPTGPRPWPRDLDPASLKRLDRWSRDEGFRDDLFHAVEAPVRKAHKASGMTAATAAAEVAAIRTRAEARPRRDIPNGTGGMPTLPQPVFDDEGPRAGIVAFDPISGQPSDRLLLLLMLAGRYPRRIEVADDGKPMARPGKPALLAPLLHAWRDDDRVVALVTKTVTESRKFGRPVWPPGIAAAVSAYVERAAGGARTTHGRLSADRGRGG